MDSRILFVVSGSYGDLAQVLYFCEGQPFRSRAAVALSRQLHDVNSDSLTLRSYSYASTDEIIGAAADWDADIVIMLTAYGLAIEGLTTTDGLRRMVEQLRDRGSRVVTTDPFLGLAPATRTIDVYKSVPSATGWKQKLRVWKAARRLSRAIITSARALRDVTHLYPTPAEAIPNSGRQRRISYFNPDTTYREEPRAQGAPSWLFVLAQTDYDVQHRRWGHTEIVNKLIGLFTQTSASGRRPVLIAPLALVHALSGALPASTDAELTQFSAYAAFERRLLNAEYAFFWNLFSGSAIVMRLLRRLPVFFFDRGHVAHIHERMYDVGIQAYFGGWEPKRLPQGVMEPGALARFWADQEDPVDEWIAYLAQSPTPTQAVDVLTSGSP